MLLVGLRLFALFDLWLLLVFPCCAFRVAGCLRGLWVGLGYCGLCLRLGLYASWDVCLFCDAFGFLGLRMD